MKNKLIILDCYLLFMLIAYIYCLPQSQLVLFDVAFTSIVGGLMSMILIFATPIIKDLKTSFKIFESFNFIYLIIPYMFSVPMIIATIFALIKLFSQKDYSYASGILPAMVIWYCSYKSYIIQKSDKNKIN